MRADVAAVDDRARLIDTDTQRFVDALPDAATRPIRESIVDVVPGSKALRQIAPRDACSRAIEHGFDEFAIADIRSSPLLRGQHLSLIHI